MCSLASALTANTNTNRVQNQTKPHPSAPCFFSSSAAAVYAFLFAPNHLGLRQDLSLLSRGFYDNALTFVLFNLLGLFPFINACLMWPALRSQGLQVRQSTLCPKLACTQSDLVTDTSSAGQAAGASMHASTNLLYSARLAWLHVADSGTCYTLVLLFRVDEA